MDVPLTTPLLLRHLRGFISSLELFFNYYYFNIAVKDCRIAVVRQLAFFEKLHLID